MGIDLEGSGRKPDIQARQNMTREGSMQPGTARSPDDYVDFFLGCEKVVVTLRMTRSVRLCFLHGGALHGLLCNTLSRHPLPAGLIPFASESGRVLFEPGDSYRFGLTVLGRARGEMSILADKLPKVGRDASGGVGPPPTFGGNFEILSIESHSAHNPAARSVEDGAVSDLTLRFLSPLRMQRPRGEERPGRTCLDADCFPAHHFLARLWRRLRFLESGCTATHDDAAATCPSIPDSIAARERQLLWIDMPIIGSDGESKGRPGGYTLGGVLGSVRLHNVPSVWRRLLVLGQQFHVGEKTNYGFGRYAIADDVDLAVDVYRPARTISERIIDQALLKRCLEHIGAVSVAAGVDGVTPDDALADAEQFIHGIHSDLEKGSYQPRALQGLLQPKPKGGIRALAIPTVADRCVQRSVVELLGPAVDALLEDCSYAYRKGFSRSQAAMAIQKAYDQGYHFVLDADIEGFFDAVAWDRMRVKLSALFPFDGIVEWIMVWIAAPVVFRGRTAERTCGLPQGTPISPLLANLFLDEFDEELLGKNYRLVRYADDFVVLCRDSAEAMRARDDARIALAALGLQLNPKKTAVTTFDAGFSYLGYLFCRSVVIEEKRPAISAREEEALGVVTGLSWLAQIPLQEIRGIEADGKRREIKTPQIVALGEASPERRFSANPLYLSGYGTKVWKKGGLLVIAQEKGERLEVPLREIAHVVLLGNVGMTLQALLALARESVPVYACSRSGELDVSLVQQSPNWLLWAAQGRKADDAETCLFFARAIIQAKLHNSVTLAVRFGMANADRDVPRMRALERASLDQQNADGLRGLEGRGAALFFGMLRDSLPAEWGFRTRQRQPPPDPVNAMLSLGYTLLYNHISSALEESGLNPRIGLFHQEKGTYHALACDLQEEFRHLVDALVWSLIRRREIKPDDFAPSADGRYPCLMTVAARRQFIGRFEKRLADSFRPNGWDRNITYREFMFRQATTIRDLVLDDRTAYEPLRIHA